MSSDQTKAAERLRTAFELFQAGKEMMRQNLRRRFRDASEEEIDQRLRTWLQTRPGAEWGDGPIEGHRIRKHE
ncbi:MAG: hypothetical protein WD273_00225 [Trueperaceae bacterium]